MNTRFGQIAHLTQNVDLPTSPLQKELSYLAKYSFQLAFIVGGVFFAIGYFVLQLSIIDALTFIVGVMIACVPEGLQATISSALAINVSKMARRNMLVKRLSAVQTLGSVTLICTDKTGTLTRGEMSVNKIWASQKIIDVSGVGYHPKGEFLEAGRKIHHNKNKEIQHLLEISALCNNAKLQPPDETNKSWHILGDPTDGAMLVAAIKYGINVTKLMKDQPAMHVFPFDPERKLVTTVHDRGSFIVSYSKGATSKIMANCKEVLINDKIIQLTEGYKRTVNQIVDQFAYGGLRVLAVAYKDMFKDTIIKPDQISREQVETGMVLVGLVALQDPPRLDVKDSIANARTAGIKVAMITGDNAITAKSIALQVGIIDIDKWNEINPITGDELDEMLDVQIAELFQQDALVFARITPDQKLRLVSIARQSGEIVAVTGDGANDAPALRQSDIGIAMGVTGTDIAKETADIILTDDSFVSIVSGIESGRAIWINLRNFIYFAFTHNWAELVPFVLFIVFRTPIPLLAIHVLLIDLCIDIVPSLALSRDPPAEGSMKHPPRSSNEHLFKPLVFVRSLIIGLVVGIIGFVLCVDMWLAGGWQWGMPLDPASPLYLRGVTMTYVAIVIGQVANLVTCASTDLPFFRRDWKKNPWISYGVAWQLIITLITVYTPFLQPIFGTQALYLVDWLKLLVIPVVVIVMQEIWRIIEKKKARN
jgi:magnesium-transporting ATPase (P-type)